MYAIYLWSESVGIGSPDKRWVAQQRESQPQTFESHSQLKKIYMATDFQPRQPNDLGLTWQEWQKLEESPKMIKNVGLEVVCSTFQFSQLRLWMRIAKAPRGWNLLTLCRSQWREQLGSTAGLRLFTTKIWRAHQTRLLCMNFSIIRRGVGISNMWSCACVCLY